MVRPPTRDDETRDLIQRFQAKRIAAHLGAQHGDGVPLLCHAHRDAKRETAAAAAAVAPENHQVLAPEAPAENQVKRRKAGRKALVHRRATS